MGSLNRERLDRFRKLLAERGFDCYVCSTPVSMGYLASFYEGGGERMLILLVRPEGDPAMIVPALSATHAAATGIGDIRAWKDGDDPGRLFGRLAEDWGLKTAVVAVDDETPACLLLPMQQTLPAALFKCGGDTMAELRKRKEPAELEAMRRAAAIADAAYADLLARMKPGMTEAEAAAVLTSGMLSRGAAPTFTIVAAGAGGAEPHHETSAHRISEGEVVVADWGCAVDHYLSDITRTFSVGKGSDDARKVYEIVYEAHMQARREIRPGIACEDVDRAARQVIEEHGYGEYFVHRTGHGIGLMGHEPPHIVQGSKSPLEEGQCFSVEPGIYLPGRFGVRIENIVTVTADGHESLNQEPSPSLIEVGVA